MGVTVAVVGVVAGVTDAVVDVVVMVTVVAVGLVVVFVGVAVVAAVAKRLESCRGGREFVTRNFSIYPLDLVLWLYSYDCIY